MSTDFFHRGFRRYQKAMQGIPDRVPVFAQMHEFAMHEVKASPKQFYGTPELLVKASLDVMAAYGIDVPLLDYDVYNIEAEALGQAIVYTDQGMPDVDRTRPLIRDRSDLKKIRTPNFEKDGRLSAVLEMHRLFQDMTGGLTSTPGFCAPFSLAANIRGIEQLLLDMVLDPPFARALLDRVVDEVLIPWVLQLKAVCPGAAGICGSDASASIPIVSPDILRKWVLPSLKRLQEQCGPDVYVPNWVGESCLKQPEEMLDLKLLASPGFVEGQDPDVEALGPLFYKSYAKARGVPLVLGVGAACMALGQPAEIRERVRTYIDVGGKDGHFALYLCNLGATTPPENVRAAVEAIRDFGVY